MAQTTSIKLRREKVTRYIFISQQQLEWFFSSLSLVKFTPAYKEADILDHDGSLWLYVSFKVYLNSEERPPRESENCPHGFSTNILTDSFYQFQISPALPDMNTWLCEKPFEESDQWWWNLISFRFIVEINTRYNII